MPGILKIKNKGFTLIEILVTTTIFVSFFTIIFGLFFSALKVQRRVLASQELIKESSYVLEYMSRQLRMSQKSDSSIDCTASPPYKNYLVSPGPTEGDSIKFRNYNNECWTFFLEGGILKVRREGGGNDFTDSLTSENLNVIDFKINISGDDPAEPPNAQVQPRITLSLKIQGKGQKIEKMPEIKIQTTVSQRNLDF